MEVIKWYCIAVKDNVSENQMLQYINQGIEQQAEPKKAFLS